MATPIDIENFWKVMLHSSVNTNKIPAGYLSVSKNARIKDNSITKRRWFYTFAENELEWNNQGITYNKYFLVWLENSLYKYTKDDWFEKIWDLEEADVFSFINYWQYTIILTWVGKPYIYDGETLRQLSWEFYNPAKLIWGSNPTKDINKWKLVTDWRFSISIDGTTRSVSWCDFSSVETIEDVCEVIQEKIRSLTSKEETVEYHHTWRFIITSSNTTKDSKISKTNNISWGTDISWNSTEKYLDGKWDWAKVVDALNVDAPDVNSIIWNKFTWFTFVVWNTDKSENILYISRPITPTEQERCYDWMNDNSEQIVFDSKVLGLASTMNKLFIFTQNRVEYIGKESLHVVWEEATLMSIPIGDGGQLMNHRCAVPIGDKVFYLTRNKNINSLFFVQWTVEPGIGTLNDTEAFKITKYLNNLDDNQDDAFGYYDEATKTAHWFLKTRNSLYNDTVLVFDVINNTWTTDTNKFFKDVVVVNWEVYAGSSIDTSIIRDWEWLNDNLRPIEFEIQDTNINLWTIREKMFKWWEVSWNLNKLTNFEITTYIDDKESSFNKIDWQDYALESINIPELWEIGWSTVGWSAIGWLVDDYDWDEMYIFDKTLDHSYIYKRGKRIRRKIVENSYWSDFYIDFYTISATATWNIELNDKF